MRERDEVRQRADAQCIGGVWFEVSRFVEDALAERVAQLLYEAFRERMRRQRALAFAGCSDSANRSMRSAPSRNRSIDVA